MAATSFYLASQNDHKWKELSELVGSSSLILEKAPQSLDVEETGVTYAENAFLKAESYYKRFKNPILSDDSGLEVSSLPGQLGVETANFGGPGLSAKERGVRLLELMEQTPMAQSDRSAEFVSVLCAYLNPSEVFFFEGRMRGMIADRWTDFGEGVAFGFDPIFIPEPFTADGKVLALDPEWKQEHSHRAKAASAFARFMSSHQQSSEIAR